MSLLSLKSPRQWLAVLLVGCAGLAASPARVSAQTGLVSGTVVDQDGTPIRGATVVARNPDASPDTLTTTTDKRGRFGMVGLRSGVWVFVAGAAGFEPNQLGVRIGGLRVNMIPFLRLSRTPGPPPGALEGVDAGALLDDLAAADARLAAGDPEAAIVGYRAILARAPALTTMHLLIGRACGLKGNDECAVTEYEAALAAGAAPERARLELGRVHLQRGDTAKAVAILTEASAQPDAGAEVWLALGQAHERAGQPDEAARAYRRAEEIDPEIRGKSK